MQAALKRILNDHIEFLAASHPASFEALGLTKELRQRLSYPEQEAVLMDALYGATQSWTKARMEKSQPDQMAFADFPHVPSIIKAGRRQAVFVQNATAKDWEAYYQKLKAKVKLQEEALEQTVNNLREQMLEELAAAKLELAEVAKLRQMMRRASRAYPDITTEQVLQRQAAKTAATDSTR